MADTSEEVGARGVIGARRVVLLVVGCAVSALFLWLTMRSVEFGRVAEASAQVSLPILSLAILTKGVAFVMMALRSQILLAPVHPYSMPTQLRSVLLGFVGNNALPFRLGELLRVGYLARTGGVAGSSVLAAVALERLLDAFSLLVVFFAVLPVMTVLDSPDVGLYAAMGVLTGAVGVAVAVSRWPEAFGSLVELLTRPLGGTLGPFVTQRANAFARGLSALASAGGALGALVTSLGYWAASILGVQVWIWAFGLSLPWYAALVITCFLAFGTLLPSAPAFVGTYHWFAAAALALFGVSEAVGVSVALVGHAAAFVPWTLIGVVVLFRELVFGLRGPS